MELVGDEADDVALALDAAIDADQVSVPRDAQLRLMEPLPDQSGLGRATARARTGLLQGRENAVARLRVNMSLAIRNAFDRTFDARRPMAIPHAAIHEAAPRQAAPR